MEGHTSITGVSRLARAVSTDEVVKIGIKLSAFDDATVGGSASVLDFILLGSTVSLTAYTRLGSGLSASGSARFGGVVRLGSSLSSFDRREEPGRLRKCYR